MMKGFTMSLPLAYLLIATAENALKVAATRAITEAAIDFVQGDNKPWTYYAGLAAGTGVALVSSRPGYVLSFYVATRFLQMTVFKNNEGAKLKVFADGILQSTLNTYEENTPFWQTLAIALAPTFAEQIVKVDVVVEQNDTYYSFGRFAAIGGISAYDDDEYTQPVQILPFGGGNMYNVINFRISDSEVNSQNATVPIYLDTTEADTLDKIQTFVNAVAPELDALTGGKIESVDVTVALTLPAGLKSDADAGILNERGALLSFDTTGPRADSVRIPAVKTSLMPGDDVATANSAVTAFVTRLTTATTANNIRPKTPQDYRFSSLRSGKKSFRK